MIDVVINGEHLAVDESQTLAELLTAKEFNCSRVAVAINSEFVARSNYGNVFLAANDIVDVVAPVAGG